MLSSAAAGCDHLDHVGTQAPYAFVVAVVSLVVGYLPIGWGVPVWVCLPVGVVATVMVLKVLGRVPVEKGVVSQLEE